MIGVASSASMVPRSHSRAMTSDVSKVPIERQHDGHGAGKQGILAIQVWVEPGPGLGADQRSGPGTVGQVGLGGRLLLEPVGPQALDVTLHQSGGIGVAAIDEDLDWRGLTSAQPVC